MKSDIQMLKTAIEYYIVNTSEIPKTVYNCIDYDKIDTHIEILIEAIDFHPFPQMLNTISRITKIDKHIVKECIWFVESGYNVRKPLTIENSLLYEKRNEWRKIECYLDDVRNDIITS
jgi:hypothetical protein